MKRAAIISIGSELTLGQIVDTNAAWLARRLAELGVHAGRHLTVADARGEIRDVLLGAAGAADVGIITGGLGPTDDDLTRQALADAAGVELEPHADSLDRIRAYFAARGRDMPDRNRVQAQVPRSGRVLPNACGTAPGVSVPIAETPCFALPGVPFEMRAMFEQEVAPLVRAAARGRVFITRVLHSIGLSESDVGERLSDLMTRGANPEVGTSATLGVISVRINAEAESTSAAGDLLDEAERVIRARLGTSVFGRDDDTLASVVGRRLCELGATVSTAESCTGGLIGKQLTDIPGSSAYYLGGAVTYCDEAKTKLLGVPREVLDTHGAVSEPVARAMAEGARNVFETDYAVSVTGIAGPGGGSDEKPVGLVYIGLAAVGEASARRFRFGADAPRAIIRERAALSALSLLRAALA